MKIKVRVYQDAFIEFVVEGAFVEVQKKIGGKSLPELIREWQDTLTEPPRYNLSYEFEMADE